MSVEEGAGKKIVIYLVSFGAPLYIFAGISATGTALLSTICMEFKREIKSSNIITPT